MTKNKLALLAVLFLVGSIAAALLYSRNLHRHIDEASAARGASKNSEEPAAAVAGVFDGIGGMSISGLEIVQGEKGSERWTLVAESAVMHKQGGDLVAQKPHLTYYLGSGDAEPGSARETLRVTSDEGDVNQRESIFRFVHNVVAIQADDVLRTDLIIYEGASNRLDCPEESHLESVGMRGKAKAMSWHLDDNTLHAWGGVEIDFDSLGRPAQGGVNKQ